LKDDFEISQGSGMQMESITKEALLQNLDQKRKRIESRHHQKQEFYPVIMALLQSVDLTICNVH
jgi:hypothetical protein